MHSNKSFRSCLRLVSHRTLLAVLLLSMATPAMAGITKSSGNMMNMPMSMSMAMSMAMPVDASIGQSVCGAMAGMSCHHVGEGTSQNTGQALAVSVSTEIDCEQECNCCPGLCSAYLPMVYISSAFLPEKTILNKIIVNTEATSTATLFRPPITH